MSLMTSLYTGTIGMQSNSLDLSVIGDNIANANTIGFKGSRTAFEDMMAQSMIGSGQRGLGSNVQAIQKLITQGALTTTGLATDLALQGNGFFVVKGNHNGTDGQYYTRAGQFTLDRDGNLVNLDGLKVQGFAADNNGVVGATLGDLQFSSATAPPRATANVRITANLNPEEAPITAAFDPANPDATSNFKTSTVVYDSLGKQHSVDVYWRMSAVGTWDWHALTDGANLQGGTAGTMTEIAGGTMTFDASGNQTAFTQLGAFNPIGAVNPQPLAFDFSQITQYARAEAVTFQSQDGYASGTLANINIDTDGSIIGTFSNGQSRTLGQVAVADFEAADQLERAGGNLFSDAPGAGQPVIGKAAS
ncbi:MAG: flagellar hook protein FlgE, partial [Myxococcaceae bacterium]|nr:flagellar hook protein FlgE [Myxococcaceae bacterium]